MEWVLGLFRAINPAAARSVPTRSNLVPRLLLHYPLIPLSTCLSFSLSLSPDLRNLTLGVSGRARSLISRRTSIRALRCTPSWAAASFHSRRCPFAQHPLKAFCEYVEAVNVVLVDDTSEALEIERYVVYVLREQDKAFSNVWAKPSS